MEQSEPLVQSHGDSGGDGMSGERGRFDQQNSLPVAEGPGNAKQNFNDKTMSSSHTQLTGQFDDEQKQRARDTSRTLGKSWTAETGSFVVSILAIAGLVGTLLAHQSKPLPQWPQLVTINSIISLFSLLMRACVGVVLAEGISQCKWTFYQKAGRMDHIERLDSASRGAWGSFTLLFHFKAKPAYYIAALGAITTILASLTGFFSQQLVQFQNCRERDATASARISRTNSYSQTGGSVQNNAPVDFAPMIAAINVGVLQRPGDLTSTLSSGCNTGNCTFSDNDSASFSTVTISRSCEDITSNIRVINETKLNSSYPNVSTYLGLDYGDDNTFEWSKEARTGGAVVRSWVDSSSSDTIDIYLLFRSGWNDTDWRIANCSIFPTVNTYAAKVKDARLDETLIDSTPLRGIADQFKEPPVIDANFTNLVFSWRFRMASNETIRNGIRESCDGSDKNATGLIPFPKISDEPTYVNLTGHTNPSAGWKWWYYPKDCIWSMHSMSRAAIAETVDELFDSQNVTVGFKGGAMGSTPLRVFYQQGNITFNSVDERMKDLATSMTTVVRTTGGDGTLGYKPDNAEGVVWVTTTCVYIRWRWMAFPAVMIGLTGIFLILVAFENRGVESDRLWKSSFLAALFCEVETHEKPVGKSEMKAMAKSTSVSLEGSSGRLRLVAG